MTGREHWRRAEALLESCQLGRPDVDDDGRDVETYPQSIDEDLSNALTAAQVHATLAGVAAMLGSAAFDMDLDKVYPSATLWPGSTTI